MNFSIESLKMLEETAVGFSELALEIKNSASWFYGGISQLLERISGNGTEKVLSKLQEDVRKYVNQMIKCCSELSDFIEKQRSSYSLNESGMSSRLSKLSSVIKDINVE